MTRILVFCLLTRGSLLLFALLFPHALRAQHFAPMVREEFYPAQMQLSDGQNQFGIHQDGGGLTYLSLNEVLVRFDGFQYKAVYFDNRDKGYVLDMNRQPESDRLFLRTSETFGYVKQTKADSLILQPLHRAPLDARSYTDAQGAVLNNNHKIVGHGSRVYYQTDAAIRMWDAQLAKDTLLLTLTHDTPLRGWYSLNSRLYVFTENDGVSEVKASKLVPLPAFKRLANEELLLASPFDSTQVLGITASKRFILLGADGYQALSPDETLSAQLQSARITDVAVNATHIVVSTEGRGLLFLKKSNTRLSLDFVLQDHNGLPDNYVHSLYLDTHGRLWLTQTNTFSWALLQWPISFMGGLGPDVHQVVFYQNRMHIAKDNGIFILGDRLGVDREILRRMEVSQKKQQSTLSSQLSRRPLAEVQAEMSKVLLELQGVSEQISDLKEKKQTRARKRKVESLQADKVLLQRQIQALQSEKAIYANTLQTQDEYRDLMQDMRAELRKKRAAITQAQLFRLPGSDGQRFNDIAVSGDYLFCGTGTQILVYKGEERVHTLKYAATKLLASKKHPGRVYVVQNDRIGYVSFQEKGGKLVWTYHMNLDAKKGAIEMSTVPRGNADGSITSLVEDAQGNLWLGSLLGVHFLNPDQGLGARKPPAITNIAKSAMVVRTGKQLLAFTGRNAYWLTEGRFKRNAVLSRYVDLTNPRLQASDSQLLSLLNNCIYRLSFADNQFALIDSIPLPRALRLRGQISEDKDDLFIAANGGLVRLPLATLNKPNVWQDQTGSVQLAWVRAYTRHADEAGFQAIDATSYYQKFSYDPAFRLELGLLFPNYDNVEGVLFYQYRIQEDGNWKTLQGDRLDLDFKPGSYEIAIRAQDAFGRWTTPVVYRFELTPPFYLRWEFLSALFIFGTLGIYLFTRRLERIKRAKLEKQNKDLEDKVNARTEELQEEKAAVQALNSTLQQQYVELEEKSKQIEAQRETIAQQERKAALGEIAPSMAHEINSPLGAIQSAADNIRTALHPSMQQLPVFISRLSPELQVHFWQLLNQLANVSETKTMSEERVLIQEMSATLAAAGIEDAKRIAQQLVKGGYEGQVEPILPYLSGDDNARKLPQFVQQLGGLFRQLNLIQASSKKAQRIIESLKDAVYQRADSSVPVEVNLRNNIETILTLYDYHLRQGIELNLEIPDDLPNIQAFPEELHQVWTNLLMNAVYAMKNHGEIRICMHADDKHVHIDLEDAGPGIPPEVLSRVFEPMFTTKPSGEGTGLGLAIVRKIVEQKHQGTITVESVPGKTVFTVSLPIDLHVPNIQATLEPESQNL